MIRQVHVYNLALIEDITVEFDGGFTVFTGETGAGKSILIGAIGLLLGDRASSEMVRTGSEEAEVSGTFDLKKIPTPIKTLLDEAAVATDGGTLIFRRRISVAGKNRIFVNQTPVPLATLKQIGDMLVDFHSQHEHQSLLNPETAVTIVDSLPQVAEHRVAFNAAYADLLDARQSLDNHDKRSAELTQRREFLEFQFAELASLDLRSGEEQELEAEHTRLSSTVERASCVNAIRAMVSEGDAPLGVMAAAVRKKLDALARFDSSVKPWIGEVDGACNVFVELDRFCASYAEAIQADASPGRVEEINTRLAKIQRLKKKHGCSLDELIAKTTALKADLAALDNNHADRTVLLKRLEQSENACRAAGGELSRARAKAVESFDKKIAAQMRTLGFDGGSWKTALHPTTGPTPDGLEMIEFLVQTNPGEARLPLIKIASGGEISRLMLAIKTVMASHDHIPTLIFDEVDTGIGGVLANEVGVALHALSSTHQVICISHLHQIASRADGHYRVYKESAGGRTVTRIKRLSSDEKVDEIARMLGGDSEISRKHAKELLRREGRR